MTEISNTVVMHNDAADAENEGTEAKSTEKMGNYINKYTTIKKITLCERLPNGEKINVTAKMFLIALLVRCRYCPNAKSAMGFDCGGWYAKFTNKDIAARLKVSEKTIQNYRRKFKALGYLRQGNRKSKGCSCPNFKRPSCVQLAMEEMNKIKVQWQIQY